MTIGYAAPVQLPAVTLNSESIGGDILLIKMKDHVIITGHESEDLVKEIGQDNKRNFTRDIVMTKTPKELAELYNPKGSNKMVQTIISRYTETLARIDITPSLN